jgi:hypothetical protein
MQLSLSSISLAAGVAGSEPGRLFLAGEQGVWYDPSDLSTMFQDSAGTTPVTAVDQPVGRILDKSRGMARGAELVTNGTFDTDTTGWTPRNANTSLSVVSGMLQVANGGAEFSYGYQTITAVVGRTYRVTLDYAVVTGGGRVQVGDNAGTSGYYDSGAFTGTGALSFVFVAGDTTPTISLLQTGATAGLIARYDNVSVREIPGNHAIQATAGSRPTLKQDASGFYYLNFDGTDDSLATSAINFTATDKMTVWAGVHKASDAAVQTAVSLGNPLAGSFALKTPRTATVQWVNWSAGGTALPVVDYAIAAPVTLVVTGQASISDDSLILRANGVQVGSSATDQGSGNFGNHALYVGSLNGASQFLNGRIYSLVIRGAASTATEIVQAERAIARKMGLAL